MLNEKKTSANSTIFCAISTAGNLFKWRSLFNGYIQLSSFVSDMSCSEYIRFQQIFRFHAENVEALLRTYGGIKNKLNFLPLDRDVFFNTSRNYRNILKLEPLPHFHLVDF